MMKKRAALSDDECMEEDTIDEKVDDVNVNDVYDDNGDGDGPPSFENVLEYLGVPGKFQVIQIVLGKSCLQMSAFMSMSIVLIGYVPPHECRRVNETQLLNEYPIDIDGNGTTPASAHVKYETCSVKITISSNQSDKPDQTQHTLGCPNGRDFFKAKGTTYTSEWDLVCELKGQAEFTQTMFTMGQIIGGLIASPITDYFGRKSVVVASYFACLLAEVAHVFSPNIFVIYLVKVFSGLVLQAFIPSLYIFVVELVVPRHRQTLSMFSANVWVFNTLVLVGVAYLFEDSSWRYLHGFSIATGFVGFFTPFVLKESPRWLATNGRMEEALDVLKHACKQNGKDFEIAKRKFNAFVTFNCPVSNHSAVPMISLKGNNDSSPSSSLTSDAPKTSADKDNDISIAPALSAFALLRHKRLLFLLAVGWYLWFTNILVYYGLYMTSSVLAGNRFVNFVLMTVVEIPSLCLALYLMNRFGRLNVFRLFIAMAAVSLMTSTLISTLADGLPGSGSAVTAMFILGKFSISGSFSVLYVITPELFPTNVRTTAFGYCSALGRFASVISPFMGLFHAEVEWGPALLFTVICILAVLITFTLPETKDLNLPNTLEDAMDQGTRSSVETRYGEEEEGRDDEV